MTPHQFIAKWQPMALSERASYVTHCNDLCDMLGHPKPLEVDPNGTWFTFERGVDTSEGKKGWADVWLDQRFGWEYKGKHKDLRSAYQQLLKYRESLNNPPLLIVCDLNKFEIHPNFSGFAPKAYSFDLEGLRDARNVQLLRDAFTEPEKLRPDRTQEAVTEEIAARFAKLADGLRARGETPDKAAHFLMKLMFCMFAEDIDLLPRGLFTDTVKSAKSNPERLSKLLKSLFEAMANGGDFGSQEVYHFNGGLEGIGTVRYPRIVPKDADAAIKLKKRTLTNLYNERPAWLANVHKRLDEAVFAAYGWPADLSDDELLAKLLALNLERASEPPA